MWIVKPVHDFLASRRARITPERAGLPRYGEKRRVPGLRREEVASLAGVSFDYYARLERGNLATAASATWSGNWQPAVTVLPPGGPGTTCGCTTPPGNGWPTG
jgi:hypothetical protein